MLFNKDLQIANILPTTLLDYPGHIACVVYTAGCNLRCPFCHNSSLIEPGMFSKFDISYLMDFLKKRSDKLEGVVFTGGEPLMYDIEEIFRDIKRLGYKIKLDTNGILSSPLSYLIDKRLVDYVAMDIKNNIGKYPQTVGKFAVPITDITDSIDAIMLGGEYGDCEYEFRTTVVEQLHDDESFIGIREMINGADKYYLQPFKDSPEVKFKSLTAPSLEDLKRYQRLMYGYVKNTEIRG